MTQQIDIGAKGYSVSKTSGRCGWHWTCPKGFNYHNFHSKEDALKDATCHAMRALHSMEKD